MLDDVINAYVRQNVEYRSAEAESTLRFLETQLPVPRASSTLPAAYKQLPANPRIEWTTTIETQSVLGSVVSVDNEIVALQQKREELRQRFTAEHPRSWRWTRRSAACAAAAGWTGCLPPARYPADGVAPQARRGVPTALYTSLLQQRQQLRVAARAIGRRAHHRRAAVVAAPGWRRAKRSSSERRVIGLLLSRALIWIARAMPRGRDPDKIEKQLGLPVYATVPHRQGRDRDRPQVQAARPWESFCCAYASQ